MSEPHPHTSAFVKHFLLEHPHLAPQLAAHMTDDPEGFAAVAGEWADAGKDTPPQSGESAFDVSHADARRVLAMAMVDAELEAQQSGEPLSDDVRERYKELADDGHLAAVLGMHPEDPIQKAWDKDAHPRDDRGRFIRKDEIEAAKSDPEKAKALLAKTTKPAERAKLEKVLGGETQPGQSKGDDRKQATKEKKEKVQASRSRAAELAAKATRGDATREELAELADHLPALNVKQLRQVRAALYAKLGGVTRRDEILAKVKDHARGMAEGDTQHAKLKDDAAQERKRKREERAAKGEPTAEPAEAGVTADAEPVKEKDTSIPYKEPEPVSQKPEVSDAGKQADSGKEPWQMTADEFHSGKLLHGSPHEDLSGGPKESRGVDKRGFFTSTDREYADHYAGNKGRAMPDGGKPTLHVVTDEPKKPLDLVTDDKARADLLDRYAAEVAKPDVAGKLDKTIAYTREQDDPAKQLNSMLYLEQRLGELRHGNSFASTVMSDFARERGHDAIHTVEGKSPTTVFLDKPNTTTHRKEVADAVAAGKPVPPEVLKDYPDLAAKPTTPASVARGPDTAAQGSGSKPVNSGNKPVVATKPLVPQKPKDTPREKTEAELEREQRAAIDARVAADKRAKKQGDDAPDEFAPPPDDGTRATLADPKQPNLAGDDPYKDDKFHGSIAENFGGDSAEERYQRAWGARDGQRRAAARDAGLTLEQFDAELNRRMNGEVGKPEADAPQPAAEVKKEPTRDEQLAALMKEQADDDAAPRKKKKKVTAKNDAAPTPVAPKVAAQPQAEKSKAVPTLDPDTRKKELKRVQDHILKDSTGTKGAYSPEEPPLPDGKLAPLRQKVAAAVKAYNDETTGSAQLDHLYENVGIPLGLSPEEFRAGMKQLHKEGTVEMTGWPKSPTDLPRPDVAVMQNGNLKVYYRAKPTDKTAAAMGTAKKDAAPVEAKPKLLKRDELAKYVPAGEFDTREEAEAAGAEAVGESEGKWYALNKRKAGTESPAPTPAPAAPSPQKAPATVHDAIVSVARSLLTPEGKFEGTMQDAVSERPVVTDGMMPLSAVKRGVEAQMGRQITPDEWKDTLNDLRLSGRVRLIPSNTGRMSDEVRAAGYDAPVGRISYMEVMSQDAEGNRGPVADK